MLACGDEQGALARADGRNRTGNLRFTRAALYQLSYVGRPLESYRRGQPGKV
jgi:hypothetical protein